MVFAFLRTKKQLADMREDVQKSFDHVKSDFKKVGDWIKHLDEKNALNKKEIGSLRLDVSEILERLEELKETISFLNPGAVQGQLKHKQVFEHQQPMPSAVQTVDQTTVQTVNLSHLTVMERAIVWALLNSNMKLSYEVLAALLGKEKSTIRGQINTLKQKNKDLIQEVREPTGKKRLYIPEEFRDLLLKNVKVRVKEGKRE